MKDSLTFWNKAAEKYARDPVQDMESYEYKLAATRAYFKPDMKVLGSHVVRALPRFCMHPTSPATALWISRPK